MWLPVLARLSGGPMSLRGPSSVAARSSLQLARRLFASEMPEVTEIRMPALSPTMSHGNVVSLKKKAGDKVKEGDILAEIETDKATLEFETADEGYLGKFFVEEGQQEVPVGALFCVLVENASEVDAVQGYEDSAQSEAQGDKEAAAASSSSPPPPPQSQSQSQSQEKKATEERASPPAAAAEGGEVRATPMARRLARERGIDLRQVQGSGPQGRVSSSDVENFVPAAPAAAPGAAAPASSAAPAAASSVPVDTSDLGQSIAQRMLWSKQNVPHYYLTVDCVVDKSLDLCARLTDASKGKYEVTLNDIIIKASAVACRRVPAANSSWQGATIRLFESVDVGVQVPVEGGFLSPVVRDADRKGLVEIAKETAELMQRVEAGEASSDQVSGATFTISNLGKQGVTKFAPIIEPPQAAILGVGAIQQVVVANPSAGGDALPFKSASLVCFTLSCDHRVLDGAVGSEWFKVFKECLEDPINLVA